MADALNFSGPTGIMKAIQNFVVAASGLVPERVLWAYYGAQRPSTATPYVWMEFESIRGIGHDYATSEGNPLTVAVVASLVDPSTDTITSVGHGLANGDGPVQITSTGTIPAGLLANTDYWVILVDADHVKLADSYVHTGGQQPLGAGNPVTPVNITGAGSGSIAIVSTADTVPAGKEIIRRAQGIREVTVKLSCFAKEGAGIDALRILTNVVSSIQLHLYELDQAGFGVSDIGQAYSQNGVQLLEGRRGSILEPRAMVDLVGYVASNITGFDTIIETVTGQINANADAGPLPAIPFTIP